MARNIEVGVYSGLAAWLQEAPPPAESRKDLPVFDARRSVSTSGDVRMGLTGVASKAAIGIHRTAADRREPRAVVTAQLLGDPAPDRLERAEALRRQIEAQENRMKIAGSSGREPSVYQDPRIVNRGAGKGHRSGTPDIEKPRGTYIPCEREHALLEARRGDQVLLFATYSDACKCLNGERYAKGETAIKNASFGIVQRAFGWTFTRLRERRSTRARRKAPV